MTNKYCPDYAKGQILVAFKPGTDASYEFAETLGEVWGYKLDDQWEHGDNTYIYLTPVDEEENACELLRSKKDFVEWSERRDLKLENRWKDIEEAIKNLSSLCDNCELPDNTYKKRLYEAINPLISE